MADAAHWRVDAAGGPGADKARRALAANPATAQVSERRARAAAELGLHPGRGSLLGQCPEGVLVLPESLGPATNLAEQARPVRADRAATLRLRCDLSAPVVAG